MIIDREVYRIRNIIGGDENVHIDLIAKSKNINEYASYALGYLMGMVLNGEISAVNNWNVIQKNGLYITNDGKRCQLIKQNT